mmetsp:Transcript_29651/g.78576  ORF Transcript_29651/g.78576 Transcript_29651/m.78576 type:complete len:113 (-) Transcript_29651:43-381(-)
MPLTVALSFYLYRFTNHLRFRDCHVWRAHCGFDWRMLAPASDPSPNDKVLDIGRCFERYGVFREWSKDVNGTFFCIVCLLNARQTRTVYVREFRRSDERPKVIVVASGQSGV